MESKHRQQQLFTGENRSKRAEKIQAAREVSAQLGENGTEKTMQAIQLSAENGGDLVRIYAESSSLTMLLAKCDDWHREKCPDKGYTISVTFRGTDDYGCKWHVMRTGKLDPTSFWSVV